jgi:cytochrome c oxidase assembly factor CtaG/polyferredoxin
MLRSWPFEPWVVVPIVVVAIVYWRGWLDLRRRRAVHFGRQHLAAFLGGLASLCLALASPLEPFAALLLQIHMLQHLLLMVVAPPLLWFGAPLLPLLRGLPVPVRRHWIAPLFRVPLLRRIAAFLTHPVVGWLALALATWLWHVPRFYELALRDAEWHRVEHACFFIAGLMFWWPVIQPFPSRSRWPRWAMLPYLLLADVQNTVLSALLSLSEHVIYPHYAAMPRLWRLSPLDDQARAGFLMWLPGSIAYLLPLVIIGRRLFGQGRVSRTRLSVNRRIALPQVGPTTRPFDLLDVPVIGRFLRWRHARVALQVPLGLLAALVVYDGLTGPQVAGMNLAGVLPWIHWRGFVVIGLLAAGNVFCLACPFLLPRTLSRRWFPARRSWPRWLRSKWLAIGLLAIFFWAYEVFSLWASPWLTAWIIVGYFVAAFMIDAMFEGASFCKYVCPIGQFHFVQSLLSPWEVRARSAAVCQQCATKDCLSGRAGIPGCELELFVPRKAGNLDCTLCLDCVHACPHDNIGLVPVAPGAELWNDRQRSGIGGWTERRDLAALVLFLTFAAFANAAGMIAPVLAWRDQLTAWTGLGHVWIDSGLFVLTAMLMPMLVIVVIGAISRRWSGDSGRILEVTTQFAYALVPLGATMWLTHFSFHLLTSAGTAIPVSQRLAGDLGLSFLGEPDWGCGSCAVVANWLLRWEILWLDLGMLLSLYAAYRIALLRRPGQLLQAWLPWAMLIVALFAVGVWIVFQPMEMRGTMS